MDIEKTNEALPGPDDAGSKAVEAAREVGPNPGRMRPAAADAGDIADFMANPIIVQSNPTER